MSVWGDRLDAAKDGPAFGGVLQGLFKVLEQAMDADNDANDGEIANG